jgi:chromate transporter
MLLLRHVPFLKSVFLYSFTAFGGPQGHMGMMVKTFVQKRKDLTEDELLEYNAFCAMLPGPTSTQTVVLIAMKRGGVLLATITLLLWVFPAALIMGALSFLIFYFDVGVMKGNKMIPINLFSYIQPMSVGFICYAAAKMMKTSVKYIATAAIMVGCLIATLFINSPWVFVSLLIVSGVISNFSNNRIPTPQQKPKKINWMNLWLFALLFIVAGVLSELAKKGNWEHGRIYHLFENFYRFGSFVFGGGQALMPMMLYQFVKRPHSQWLTAGQLLTGYGMVQAVPGPVFSICSFAGGVAMSQYGGMWQVMGCIVATVAVFLPSTLLLFFLFPIYENLKHHVIIFRALEGFNAAVVGIIWASGLILFQSIAFDPQTLAFEWSNLVVVLITFSLLYYSKIPAPLIVLGWLLLGWTLH